MKTSRPSSKHRNPFKTQNFPVTKPRKSKIANESKKIPNNIQEDAFTDQNEKNFSLKKRKSANQSSPLKCKLLGLLQRTENSFKTQNFPVTKPLKTKNK